MKSDNEENFRNPDMPLNFGIKWNGNYFTTFPYEAQYGQSLNIQDIMAIPELNFADSEDEDNFITATKEKKKKDSRDCERDFTRTSYTHKREAVYSSDDSDYLFVKKHSVHSTRSSKKYTTNECEALESIKKKKKKHCERDSYARDSDRKPCCHKSKPTKRKDSSESDYSSRRKHLKSSSNTKYSSRSYLESSRELENKKRKHCRDCDKARREKTNRRSSPDYCRRRYTPSPSSSNYKERKHPPKLLFGDYRCDICNISLNSLHMYQNHISGKKHQKAVEAQNMRSAAKTFIPVEPPSQCPQPPPGYRRKKLSEPAKIQAYLDRELKTPCPGLHKVRELRGVSETLYYCSMCDAHCNVDSLLPHLSGFKHQLNCLKYYREDLYERWSSKEKYQVKQAVADELRHVEKKHGRGLLRVEKDVPENVRSPVIREKYRRAREEPDRQAVRRPSSDVYSDYLMSRIPDPSKSGYYCRMCDSHSNSLSMWQSHVVGKRHLANLNKGPGASPSKRKFVAAPDKRAYLMDELDDIREPVVGLDQIREIRKPEINGVQYKCFLCCACLSTVDIVEHVLSRKHRQKYLESINNSELETVKRLDVTETAFACLIEDICGRIEDEKGSGIPEVFYSKKKVL